MQLIKPNEMETLSNPGVASRQLLNPGNCESARVTITRVTVAPGAEQPRHAHRSSEQVWVALRGQGKLLLRDGGTQPFREGEVARFAEGDVHGFLNDSGEPFEYLSVTTPPIDFTYAYKERA